MVACSSAAPAQVPKPPPRAWSETGVASWYGGSFNGRVTASGEVLDVTKMTAAHPSLPFGTVVLVENLETGERAEVRINDRGPFTKGRIIDVSRAAAEVLGLVGPGTAMVRITLVRPPDS